MRGIGKPNSTNFLLRSFSCVHVLVTARPTQTSPALKSYQGQYWLVCILFRLANPLRSSSMTLEWWAQKAYIDGCCSTMQCRIWNLRHHLGMAHHWCGGTIALSMYITCVPVEKGDPKEQGDVFLCDPCMLRFHNVSPCQTNFIFFIWMSIILCPKRTCNHSCLVFLIRLILHTHLSNSVISS